MSEAARASASLSDLQLATKALEIARTALSRSYHRDDDADRETRFTTSLSLIESLVMDIAEERAALDAERLPVLVNAAGFVA